MIIEYKKEDFVGKLGSLEGNHLYTFKTPSYTSSDTLRLNWWMKIIEYKPGGYLQLELTNTGLFLKFMPPNSWTFRNEPSSVVKQELLIKRWYHISIQLEDTGRLYVNNNLLNTDFLTDPPSLVGLFNNKLRLVNVVALFKELKVQKETNEYMLTSFNFVSRNIKTYPICESEHICSPELALDNIEPYIDEVVRDGEYFAGNSFKRNTLLHIDSNTNQGIRIPVNNSFRRVMEWTIELWVYVKTERMIPIISLEGSNAKLSISAKRETVDAELLYGTVGASTSLRESIPNTWTHISLVTYLSFPQYALELGLNGNRYSNTGCIVTTHEHSFDFLNIGMNIPEGSEVYFKEIRVWKIPRTRISIARQMQRELRGAERNNRLVFYFPVNEITIDGLIDRSHGGVYLMWNNVDSAKIVDGFSEVLKICDEYSFYNEKTYECEKDADDLVLGLEQSTNFFTVPLSRYYFNNEWTFEFWMYVEHLAGLSTYILNQMCIRYLPGAMSIRKMAMSNIFEFGITGTRETILFTEVRPQWIHYAFIYDAYKLKLFAYKNGFKIGEINGYPLPSCDMTIGEASTANIVIGKFRELRIWNEAKSIFKLMRDKNNVPSRSGLAFYLPLDEEQGDEVVERIQNTHVKLNKLSYDEAWTSKADFKMCKEPFTYSTKENICTCNLYFKNNRSKSKSIPSK